MTDQQLRDELHRIAEGAPTAYVPANIFMRGRRAHHRSVAVVVGSIAAVVALVAGSIALAPTHDSAEVDPARGQADLAVPDTIYAAPTWLAESEYGRYSHADDLEQDLAIGGGAIAYVQSAEDSNTAVAVVIDADDGDYHPLDLPDFIGLDPYWTNSSDDGDGHRPLALSPDGGHLAWAWGMGRYASEDGSVAGGVRVADLTTGDVTEWDLDMASCPATNCDDRGVYVSDLEWSDGGKKLLWAGSRMDRWDQESYVPGDAVAGVLDPVTTSITPYTGTIDGVINLSTWAVADDGTIAYNGAFDSGDLQLQPVGSEATSLALPAKTSMGEPVIFHGSDLYISTEDGLARLDGAGPTYIAPDALPLQLMGWVGEAPLTRSSSDTGDAYIGQLGTSKNARVLIEFDDAGHVAGTVSVAYALIDPDATEPTVRGSRPLFLPPWLKTAAFWLLVGLIAVAAWRWRHRTRVVTRSRRLVVTVTGALVALALLAGLLLGVLFVSPATFSPGSAPEDPGDLVTIPSAASTGTPNPSRAVIPRDIRWTDNPDKFVPLSDSLAVGRATLAFPDQTLVTDGGAAVVLTVDGEYHRLPLPGVSEAWAVMEEHIQLSADGTRLAYVTEDQSLNLIDLQTGEVVEHPLDLGGDRITSFSMSPDSTWLVWHSAYERQTAGRISPDGTTEPLPPGNWAYAGIGNDGTVVVRTGSGTRIWPDDTTDLPDTGQEGLSTWVGTGALVDGVDDPGVRSIGGDSAGNVDLAIGRNPVVLGVDVDSRRLMGIVGWMADGTPLIATSDDDGNDLRTVSPDGETKIVAHVDHLATNLTIATALPADLAVTAPDPDWTWMSQLLTTQVPTALLAMAVIGLAVLVVWLRLRGVRRDRRAEL